MTMPTTTCGYSYESDARLSFLASSNRRYNVQDVLSLLDNSDIDLSDSDDEVGDGASDPGEISASSESSSSSDQSDVVQPPPAQRRKLYRKTRVHNPPLKPAVTVNDRSQEHANWTPLDYFDSYIDDDILDVMADMTNRHHLQQTGATLHTSTVEVNKWIGMSIMMGCMNLKRIRLYWQRSTRVPSIANCMTRNRFFKLRNHLTVVDNNSVSDDDKAADRMWKVRPFIERVRKTCLKLEKDQDVCIDEQMISFTGRCPARQYVPRKPSPTGLKNFVLAGASGIVYDFSLYRGAGMYTNYVLNGKPPGQGTGSVLRLCESLREGHRLFCDRFFTTLPLITALQERHIYLTGTITKRNVPASVGFTSDLLLSRQGRGSSEQFVSENDIAIVKWYDNKPILMASSAFGIEPEGTCSRWCKKDKVRKQVTRPAVIAAYNKSMGGVDMCDRMIAYHKISSRTRRWNLRVLLHFVDLVLSNSWLEWKKDGNSGLQLYDFRISVATSLMNAAEESDEDDDIRRLPKKNAIVGLPTDPYRTSSASHLPVWEDLKNSARCRREGCRFKTRIKCTKCGVFLCTTSGRNCFKDFHE